MRQAQITDAPDKKAIVYDIAHAVRIISNVLSFYIFRVTEYMRGNKYCSQVAEELSVVAIEFISELIEQGNMLIQNHA